MKPRLIDREHGLHTIAAAVLMAFGSAAVAQQPGEPGAELPQTQQQDQRKNTRRRPPLSQGEIKGVR